MQNPVFYGAFLAISWIKPRSVVTNYSECMRSNSAYRDSYVTRSHRRTGRGGWGGCSPPPPPPPQILGNSDFLGSKRNLGKASFKQIANRRLHSKINSATRENFGWKILSPVLLHQGITSFKKAIRAIPEKL